MANFPIFHGLTLAANSFVENLHVERLAEDPVPVSAGRLWFNSTEKKFKFSSLDAGGAVIVRTFFDSESASAALAALSADLAAEVARASAAEGVLTTDLSAEVARATAAESALDAKINATKAELLGGIPPETLDTIRELAAALRDNPDIVTVIETKIGTDIAAAKAELKGAVSEAMDTLAEIEVAVNKEVADRVAAVAAEAAARASADSALSDRVTAVESQASGKIGDLAGLATDAKSDLVSAINEVVAELGSEVARAQAAEAAEATRAQAAEAAEATRAQAAEAAELARAQAAEAAELARAQAAEALIRSDYNARRATYASANASMAHTFAHGLNSDFVDFTVLVERPDGKYRNDVVSVEEVDSNTLKVYLSVAAKIKLAVTSMASL